MRYLVPLLALVASIGMASPASTINRDVTSYDVTSGHVVSVEEMTDAIAFAASQSACDLFKCAAVIADFFCITACIFLGPAAVPCILGCVAGGASAVRVSRF